MRRSTALLILCCLALYASPAAAQVHCAFGAVRICQDDPPIYPCTVDTEIFVPVEVPFMFINSSQREIRELSFQLENMPVQGPSGILIYTWFAQSVSGDPETGLTLDFDPPLPADALWQTIGSVYLLPIMGDWIGEYHTVYINGNSSTDIYGQEIRLGDQQFRFNVDDGEDGCCVGCGPSDVPYVFAQDFAPVPGDYVGDSFPLSFTAHGFICNDVIADVPLPYAGRVYVEGTQVAEFAGMGTQYHAFTLSAAAVPPGEVVHVDIEMVLDGDQATQSAHLEYIRGEATGVDPPPKLTLSVLKQLYR